MAGKIKKGREISGQHEVFVRSQKKLAAASKKRIGPKPKRVKSKTLSLAKELIRMSIKNKLRGSKGAGR